MQRKCSYCGFWNEAVDYCVQCNTPISSEAVRQNRQQIELDKKAKEIKPKLDAFFERWKNSSNPILSILYKIAYGIWTVYMAIVSFIIWIVALGPG